MLAVAPTANPVFTGSISLGRTVNSTIGDNSFAFGYSVEASGNLSHAEGSHTTASGGCSHAEGGGTTASGSNSHAEGMGTTASGAYSHVSGQFNVEDSYSNWSEWVANTSYSVGDKVKRTSDSSVSGYICKTANSDSTFTSSNWTAQNGKMNYAEIIGNGLAANNKSNARVLDWDGNEYLKGSLYVGCNTDSTGGTQVATISDISGFYTKPSGGIPNSDLATPPAVMTGATSSAAGTSGLVPAPATTDVDKFLAGDGTYKSGGLPMVILSYGSSTWQDFINAYNNNVIVYCRASSNSNPATGSQTRMAFMAYVNDASSPTNVEFQYYRSMSSHSATAMGDEVYVYKLTNASGGTWSVTTRKASIKEIDVASGSKLGVSWSSDKVTLSNTMTADDMPMSSSDATTAKSAIDTINTKLGSTTMGTTATTVTGAIAEHESDISTLNSNFTSRIAYTPSITSGCPGFTVDNINFNYVRSGKLLFINGRFNITNVGSAPTTNNFIISLPSGFSCINAVGSAGYLAVNKNGVDLSRVSIRQDANTIYAQVGAGGDGSLGIVGTGYIIMNATVMLS